MEQLALKEQLTQEKIHNNKDSKNNIKNNRIRIKLFGKKYTIDKKRLELYHVIGEGLIVIGIFASMYISHCIMYCLCY